MSTYYELAALDNAHDCAYKLGEVIRQNVSSVDRLKVIEALVNHLQAEDENLSDRMCRMFQIGLSQGLAEAYSKGTLDSLRDTGRSS